LRPFDFESHVKGGIGGNTDAAGAK
jgi:hypothetical protein